jgi:rubrerythrin
MARALLNCGQGQWPGEVAMDRERLNELLYEALETEQGGIQIYETAIVCCENEELREEWEKYYEQTRMHEQILMDVFATLGLDPEEETPGRQIVREKGQALVEAMAAAQSTGDRRRAQIVAAECVVEAETKDHLNWELIGEAAKKLKGAEGKALLEAFNEVEDEEDEHLYHTQGWCRELWLQSLGLPAVLPPPEEKKKVKTELAAARVRQARKEV